MRKILALYTNEMIKISKKVSVIVLLAAMVAIIFGFGGIMKYQDNVNKKQNNTYSYGENFQKDEMNRQLESAKAKISEIEKKESSASGAELESLKAQKQSNQNQVDMLQYAVDNDIFLYTSSYRADAVQRLFSIKEMASQLKRIPQENLTDQQKKQLSDSESSISTLEQIVKNKDFKGYLDFKNNGIRNNSEMSDEEKKIYLQSNDLRLKYNITGEKDGKAFVYGNADSFIRMLENGKRSLLYNLDYTGNDQVVKPLTEKQRNKIQNDIAVIEYKFDKGIISSTTTNNFGLDVKPIVMSSMMGIGIFMTAILGIILAGGSVSSEISTGSIKSLIISPTKRWKIFVAKGLSLLTVGIISIIIAFVFSVIANGIFFGFDSGSPYIYASGGVAHELNFYVYQFVKLLVDFVQVLVFMLFAFMLSVITRNTAASVAISIAVLFIGSNANQILMQFTRGEWRKFIPFNNLDFTSKIFPNDTLMQVSSSMPGAVNNSLTFSVIYIAIMLLCMAYVGLDSFNRRDIR